jgi:hypothetical protein
VDPDSVPVVDLPASSLVDAVLCTRPAASLVALQEERAQALASVPVLVVRVQVVWEHPDLFLLLQVRRLVASVPVDRRAVAARLTKRAKKVR